ncbi:MAG: phosphodiester glycosidase family protein [Candidatus Altimarinota bacterium]
MPSYLSLSFKTTLNLALLLIFSACTMSAPVDIPTQPTEHIIFEEISSSNENNSSKKFLLAKINPAQFRLEVVENQPEPNSKSINEIHQENSSILTFNGTYYTEDFQPTGLLLSNNKPLYPLVKGELINGVFTINQNAQPKLYTYEQFQNAQADLIPELEFAIQSGPILINEAGEIIVSEENKVEAGRTIIGLDNDNQIIVIELRQTLLNSQNKLPLFELAKILKNDPAFSELGLHSVLNLDGGRSSGLSFESQSFPEYESVQNIIITKARSK